MKIKSPVLDMRTGPCRNLKPFLILLWADIEDLTVGLSNFSLNP